MNRYQTISIGEQQNTNQGPIRFDSLSCNNLESDIIRVYAKYPYLDSHSNCLVYELLGSQLATHIGLKTPESGLIEVQHAYYPISSTYLTTDKVGKICFASVDIGFHDVLKEEYQFNKSKYINLVKHPEEIVLVTLFDLWIDNTDRRVTNSNILINFTDQHLYVFDHYDCFGGVSKLNQLNPEAAWVDTSGKIIESDFGQFLLKQIKKENFDQTLEEFRFKVSNHEQLLRILATIRTFIPTSWLISSTLFEQLESFLLNTDRIERVIDHISRKFRPYTQ